MINITLDCLALFLQIIYFLAIEQKLSSLRRMKQKVTEYFFPRLFNKQFGWIMKQCISYWLVAF